MQNYFEEMKILFPETKFVIIWRDKKLYEMAREGMRNTNIDWSDHVVNWEPFRNIIRSGYELGEWLTLTYGPDEKTLVFYNSSNRGPLCVDARLVIKNKPFKEEKDMKEVEMKRELTLEERIDQLEKEKEEIQKQIKNQAKYDEIREIGDNLALVMKAMQDSGFSREEVMQIFTITMMGNIKSSNIGFDFPDGIFRLS